MLKTNTILPAGVKIPVGVKAAAVGVGLAVAGAGIAVAALRCRADEPALETLKKYRYAHRGLHEPFTYPENSLAAFRRAIEHGYGAELDVHLMKDGGLAVIHDSSLLRTCGVDVRIEDLTAEDLPKYPLEGSGETVPLFRDVLQLFEHKTPLIVELKQAGSNYAALTSAAMALMDQYKVTYCVESFDPRCIEWLRENRPEVIRGQLSCRFEPGTDENPLALFLIQNLLTNTLTEPDFIAYKWEDRKALPLQICRRVYGVQEVSWTIRTPEDADAAEKDGNIVIFEGFGF